MRFLLLFVCVAVISAAKLTWKDLQSVGSRVATNQRPPVFFPNQDWSKPTLREQLDRGVQMFEFWLQKDVDGSIFIAYEPPIAIFSNCPTQAQPRGAVKPSVFDCSEAIVDYVRENPYNPPLFIELGYQFTVENSDITDLEDQLTEKYSDVVYTLQDYLEQGKYSSVAEAIRGKGFPTIEETRGKIVFITFSCVNSCPEQRVSKFFERTTPPSLELLEEAGHENTMFLCDTCRGMVEVTEEIRARYITTAYVDSVGGRLPGYFDVDDIVNPVFLTIDSDQDDLISLEEFSQLSAFEGFDTQLGVPAGTTAGLIYSTCDNSFGDQSGMLDREEIEICVENLEVIPNSGLVLLDYLTPRDIEEYIDEENLAIQNDINFLYAWNVMPGQHEGQVVSVNAPSPGCVKDIPAMECYKALTKCPAGDDKDDGDDNDDDDDDKEDPCEGAKNKKKCKKAGDNCMWDKKKEKCYLDICPAIDNKSECKDNGCKWKNDKKGCIAK